MRAIEALRRFRQLKRLMGTSDATRFALSENSPGLLHFNMNGLPHPIFLRGGSSDVGSFNQIFINMDIDGPSPASPKFIIDAGANVGMSTLFYAMKYPDAKIVAIEPEAENFAILQRNCAGYRNIQCLNAALWGTEGTTLSLSNPGAGSWGFQTTPEKGHDIVPTVSIDSIMRDSGADRADIVKIDIEGAESDVFSKPPAWLNHVSTLTIELHDRFKPGCAQAFYRALSAHSFMQLSNGQSLFIDLRYGHRYGDGGH